MAGYTIHTATRMSADEAAMIEIRAGRFTARLARVGHPRTRQVEVQGLYRQALSSPRLPNVSRPLRVAIVSARRRRVRFSRLLRASRNTGGSPVIAGCTCGIQETE